MKRLNSSSDSLDEQKQHQQEQGRVYCMDFQSILDGLDSDGCVDESIQINEKKRRLSLHQVKALEKNFEVENKLEPERKVKLAQELGLQPRQVAVWFQNRRARWKTKQLERDYGVLKSNYDNLKVNFDDLQREKESLIKEIMDLKSRLNNETPEQSNTPSVKEYDEEEADDDDDEEEEEEEEETELIVTEQWMMNTAAAADNILNDNSSVVSLFPEFKQAFTTVASSTESDDSSVILNDSKEGPNGAVSSNGVVLQNLILSSSSEYVKIEEESLFGGEESCDFFSEEQAPTLHWDCPDQWTR